MTDAGAKIEDDILEALVKKFTCSITHDLMVNPVLAADGQFYDEKAIKVWLKDHDTSPLTNKVLKHKYLTECHFFNLELKAFYEKYPEKYPKPTIDELVVELAKNERILDKTDNVEIFLNAGGYVFNDGLHFIHKILFHCSEPAIIHAVIDHPSTNLECTTPDGNRAISIMCSNKHKLPKKDQFELIKHLVEKKVELNFVNKDGCTPLLTYLRDYHGLDIMKYLIEHGADVKVKNKAGWTPLHYICEFFEADTILSAMSIVVDHGAIVDTKTNCAFTPLHIMCSDMNHVTDNDVILSGIKYLVEHGANVTTKNWSRGPIKGYGYAPLHFICSEFTNLKNTVVFEAIKYLVEKGADVTGTQTPLHIICSSMMENQQFLDIVKYLVEKGASWKAKNYMNVTPLELFYKNLTKLPSQKRDQMLEKLLGGI